MLFEQKFYKINVQNYLKILFSICSISRRRRLKKDDTEGDKNRTHLIRYHACMKIHKKKGSSDKWIGEVEGCFIPFWVHLAST